MAELTADVRYTESRNRLTTAFRAILAIPHVIVMQVWGYLAEILAVIQWFIIVFTGTRNQGLWDLQRAWIGYAGRVVAYASLLFDEYPAFGTDQSNVPMVFELEYEEPANRVTNGLRFIWIIPALIIGIGLGIAVFFVAVVSWFAILFTGRHPRGMWDFILKVTRFTLQLNAYGLLLTDTYPKWGSGVPTPVGGGGSAPLPPPTPHTV
jgi:hypothetical protein